MRNLSAALLVLLATSATCQPVARPAPPAVRVVETGELLCSQGAVNALSRNYGPFPDPGLECPVDLVFDIRNPDDPSNTGWQRIGEIPDVGWMGDLAAAHRLMYLVGRCGVILYGTGGWESPGVFWPGSMVRVEAVERCPLPAQSERRPQPKR